MYVIAIIGDLCSLIPFVNMVTSPLTGLVLYMAGPHEGVDLYSPDNIGPTIGIITAEMIPFISALPLWTLRVYFAKKAAREGV